MTFIDHSTWFTSSRVIPSKTHPYASKRLHDDILLLGHRHFIFKSDQEPSILDLKNRVRSSLDENTKVIFESSPVGDHQANGVVERAIQSMSGLIRTLKDALETNYEFKIPSDHPILPWLVSFASSMLNRCEIGIDGRTSYERLKGKRYLKALPQIGEFVYYLPVRTSNTHMNKLEPKFLDGIFVGIQDQSDEVLVGTSDGVVKARSYRRRPPSLRWPVEQLKAMKGLPWISR